jgi:hypothetical protein
MSMKLPMDPCLRPSGLLRVMKTLYWSLKDASMPLEIAVHQCFVQWFAKVLGDTYISMLVVQMTRQTVMALGFSIYTDREVQEKMTGSLTDYSGHEAVRHAYTFKSLC